MLLTTHALTGAILGKNISNLWLLIPLSLVLHFTMDHLRHGEYVESFDSRTAFSNTWWKVGLDISISAIVLLAFLYFNKFDVIQTRNILLGSFFSAFPDLLTVIYWKFKFKLLAPIYHFHSWCHKYPRGVKERNWTLRNSVNDIAISLIAIMLFIF
ncbi:MAG: hypothetical protein UT50_C0009G0015 [Candidatus Moranbacteria bacterium GW2011_GWA2_39_41]|nr:MAG: hypothetical protein UT50_C0009G0015 [Candidatus Moranbacteria bacterium GW2011_GWA2_39_41]